MSLFKKKLFIYSQAEIADHLGLIAQLNKDRDKQMQVVALSSSDSKQQKHLEQLDRIDDNLMTAQLSLAHMLKRNERIAKEAK